MCRKRTAECVEKELSEEEDSDEEKSEEDTLGRNGHCSGSHNLIGYPCTLDDENCKKRRQLTFDAVRHSPVSKVPVVLTGLMNDSVCPYCGKQFYWGSHMVIHLASHGHGLSKCLVCSKVYSYKYNCIQHALIIHGLAETLNAYPKEMHPLIYKQLRCKKVRSRLSVENRKRKPKRETFLANFKNVTKKQKL